MPAAIYDDDDLHWILGAAPDNSSVEQQVASLKGGVERHLATTAFLVKDVVLSGGHLYTHRMVYRFGSERALIFAKTCDTEIRTATLASSPYGVKYFGHWMSDDLPLGLTATSLGRPISMLADPTSQQAQYLQILGLNFETPANGRIAELTLFEDFAQNDYKRERYALLRRLVRGSRSATPANGVLLLRGSSGSRRVLLNESALAETVRARGYRVLDPGRESASSLIAACLDARVVIGVEGSQLTNGLMWMDPNGALVVIQPPSRFNIVHKHRCDAEDIRFAFTVGRPRGGDEFEVDLSRLERLLDRISP